VSSAANKEVTPWRVIIVGTALDLARTHGKQWLAPIKRLDLALLVDAQHQGAFRRRHVKPNDIAHFLDEPRVGGELERLATMRLQTEGAPDALHARNRDARSLRHMARTPVRGARGGVLQGPYDHSFDLLVLDRARSARTRLVIEPIQARREKAASPFADRGRVDPQPPRDFLVLPPAARCQHDARSQRHRLSRLAPPGKPLQFRALLIRQNDSGHPATSHCILRLRIPYSEANF
jgi:hypothetical protein